MISRTVPEVLQDAVTADPDGLAIFEAGRATSYARLQAEADAGANALTRLGLQQGDRVVLWAPNSTDWIVAAIAAHLCGAILVPLNTRLKPEEAAGIIRRTGAKFVAATEHFLNLDNIANLRAIPELEGVTLISLDGAGASSWRGRVDSELAGGKPAPSRQPCQSGDVSDFIFTSGTTGLPKGVVTTHAQTTANARAWGDAVGLTEEDTYLIINPFFHTFGYKAGWLAALWFRTTIIPMATFNAEETCKLIETQRVAILPGPPTLFEDLIKFEGRESYDLSSLRAAVTGAAVVPEELVRQMQSVLGIDQVMTAYGLTESCGVATITERDDPIDRISTTTGRPLDGVEIMIANEEGMPVETGETGEVLLRSAYNFIHYLDDPEATAATYSPNGWMKTGDLGRLDSLGYLTITGRKKEMFICGGFNCYPAEIEFQLRQHPDIEEVAIIGIPDARMGEVGAAFVTLKPGTAPDTAAILDWARSKIANYKVPRKMQIVDALPRNSLGKIEKHKLPDLTG